MFAIVNELAWTRFSYEERYGGNMACKHAYGEKVGATNVIANAICLSALGKDAGQPPMPFCKTLPPTCNFSSAALRASFAFASDSDGLGEHNSRRANMDVLSAQRVTYSTYTSRAKIPTSRNPRLTCAYRHV